MEETVNEYYTSNNATPETDILKGWPEIIDLIPPNLKGNAIDIGCGNGELTKLLSLKYETVLGIDFLGWMIDYARENNAAENITYIKEDIFNIEFPDSHYDLVFSANCLIHMEDKIPVLTKIYNMLKRGGDFIFMDVTDRLNQTMPEGNYCLSVQEYLTILQKVGFTNITYIKEENKIVGGRYSGNLFATFKCSK